MKTKKIIGILILVLMMTTIFIGCGEDPIEKDLKDYVNNGISKLASLESEVLNQYSSVTGDNYKSDEEAYTVINNSVIPKYRSFISKLEEIKPQTPEVKAIHEIYIQAANNQYNAFLQLTAAIEAQDPNLVIQANEKLDKARAGIRDYQSKLTALAKKYNIELK